MKNARSRINRTDLCKLQATFFGHEMRGERLEHLVTTGMIIGKSRRGKQHQQVLDGLTKRLK